MASIALLALFLPALSWSQSWTGVDVGAVGAAGSTTPGSGTVTINASGADIGGTADEMHFAYVEISGDVELIARLPELTRTHSSQTKAGLMIRSTLAADASHAYSFIRSGGFSGLIFRGAQAGAATTVAGPAAVKPGWMRLTRVGNTLTAYTGSNGTTWTQIGQTTLSLPASVFVGLAVTSRVDGVLATAVFDNITVSGYSAIPDTTPPSVPQNLRTTAVSSNSVGLEWDASTDTGGAGLAEYHVFRNGGMNPIGTTSAPQYNDTTVSPNTNYSYGVSAIDLANPPNQSAQSNSLPVTTPSASVSVPNVLGQTQAAAQQAISNAGLSVGTVTIQISASVPAGSVISQNPAAGASVASGSSINLVVSSGSGSTPPAQPQPLVLNASNDVGAVGAAGSMTQANGVITVVGSGNDIGGTADEMHFGYVQLSGDVDVAMRLPSLTATHASATKAGIMMRESLSANSRHAYSYIRSAGYPGLLSRATTAGTSATVEGARVTRPGWIRLTRNGSTFTAFAGQNGTNWTQVGQVTLSMPATIYVGLAVTSRVDGALATADFDNVTYSGSAGSSVSTPNVVGQAQSTAQSNITAAGLVVGSVTSQSSSTVPSGSVISQTPIAGANVAAGTAINLVVSTGPAADVTPPTQPQSILVTGTTSSSISLGWSASTDTGGAGLAGYRIFRDSAVAPIGTTPSTNFTDTGRSPNTSHNYTVVAFDNASPANESTAAGPVTGTTTAAPADTIPPSVPQNLQVSATTTTSVSLSWQASTDTGGSGVAGYRVYRIGTTAPVGSTGGTTFVDTGRSPSTSYTYRVSAIDSAVPANESAQSASVVGTTLATGGSCTVAITGGAAVMNVGERATYTANVTGGTTPITYQWSVSGDTIKDYEDRTGFLWTVTPMAAADFQTQALAFYWKPDPSQRHPLNGGPVNRTVSVNVQAGATSCSAQIGVSVERNMTSITRQAEDFYTSNHPDAGGRGRVRNDHSAWHRDWMPGVLNFGETLFDFHREFVDRFNSWRQEFGYPAVVPWDPGTPVPTGPDIDHTGRKSPYVLTPRDSWFTLAGGATPRPSNGTVCDTTTGQRDLLDFTNRNILGCAVNAPMHSNVHNRLGGNMATTVGAPTDPVFWRWHEYMDLISQDWLAGGGSGSAMLAIPTAEQRLVASDAALLTIVAANQNEHQHHQMARPREEVSKPGATVQQRAVHDHHPPAAATAGPNVTQLTEEEPDSVVRQTGRAARGPRIVYEAPFRTRPFVVDLPSVTVTFSIPVFGLTADALTVNGSPATSVTGTGAGPYVFQGFARSSEEVLIVRFNGRKVRDAEGNRGGNRSWRYWVVKAGEDRDNDGLDDADEVTLHMTNPRLRDTDADGMPDGFEVPRGCLNPWEDERAPHDMAGGSLPGDEDADDDGVDNLTEYYAGTDPCSP